MSKFRAARIANAPKSSSHGGKKSGSGGNSKQGARTPRSRRPDARAERRRPRIPEDGTHLLGLAPATRACAARRTGKSGLGGTLAGKKSRMSSASLSGCSIGSACDAPGGLLGEAPPTANRCGTGAYTPTGLVRNERGSRLRRTSTRPAVMRVSKTGAGRWPDLRRPRRRPRRTGFRATDR